MASRYRVAAILVFSFLISVCSGCNVDDVAVYKVKLNVLWDEEMFPGEYKTNRVQWSPVFGQSHNKSYALYRIGDVSRPLLRDLTQSDALDHLEEEGEEDPKVYDQFSADVTSGVAESMVFVDGGHSLVSLITMMVPPPHWLIGVDSLDVCVDSSWVDQVTLDLEPLDVGGNTFDGETPEPVKKVTHLTEDFSFHHRKFRKLPPIAKVEFTKIKEYSTKELNDLARKELTSSIVRNHQKDMSKSYSKQRALKHDAYLSEETTKNNLDQLRDLEEEPVGTPKSNDPENNVVVVRKPTEEPQQAEVGSLQNMDDVVLAVANGKKMGLGQHLPRHFRSRLHHAVNRKQGRDCKVSEWSDWSGCSDPCGSGVMVRIRSLTQKKKGEGRPCPALIEKKSCGHKCRGDGDYVW